MMTRAFYERVLFEVVEKEENKREIYGITNSEIVEIRILDWGTNRDGSPFGAEAGFGPGDLVFIRKDSMGISVGEDKWLLDRGHILGIK